MLTKSSSHENVLQVYLFSFFTKIIKFFQNVLIYKIYRQLTKNNNLIIIYFYHFSFRDMHFSGSYINLVEMNC